MRFLNRLSPRHGDFFAPLGAIAEHAAANAAMLRRLLGDPRTAPALLPPMHAHRRSLDDQSEGIDRLLAEVFIPPIDPEDIAQVNADLHRLGDAIDDAGRLFSAMSLGSARQPAIAMCELLVAATRELVTATAGLRKADVVRGAAARIREIEHRADSVYDHAVSALFDDRTDPMAVLKWKEVFDRLEGLIDLSHHAGRLLDRIAVKTL